MKRPEKLKSDNLNFGHNLSGDARQENGKIWGANEMWEEWEKYHNWYIKEECVKKDKIELDVGKVAEIAYEQTRESFASPGYAVKWKRLKREYPEIYKQWIRIAQALAKADIIKAKVKK